MRVLLFALCLFFSSLTQAQQKLYYFYGDKDSTTIGVRNDQGHVLIKPQKYFFEIDENKEIKGATIEFSHFPIDGDYPVIEKSNKNSPVIPLGLVYDRKGEFLYFPQFFDNGSDYFSEGLRRYVENGKIGFVDLLGNKITAANWGFASTFNYGYAEVNEGEMTRKFEDGGEHWTVIPTNDQVITYLINVKGERVEPQTKKLHPKDYVYQRKYYPYPFKYTDEEQKILDNLNQEIKGVTLLYNLSVYHYEYTPLQLEITERPNAYAPYYVVKAFDEQQEENDGLIYVDAKSHKAYILNYGGEMPIKDAMLRSIQDNLTRDADYILPKTRKLAEEEVKRLSAN